MVCRCSANFGPCRANFGRCSANFGPKTETTNILLSKCTNSYSNAELLPITLPSVLDTPDSLRRLAQILTFFFNFLTLSSSWSHFSLISYKKKVNRLQKQSTISLYTETLSLAACLSVESFSFNKLHSEVTFDRIRHKLGVFSHKYTRADNSNFRYIDPFLYQHLYQHINFPLSTRR